MSVYTRRSIEVNGGSDRVHSCERSMSLNFQFWISTGEWFPQPTSSSPMYPVMNGGQKEGISEGCGESSRLTIPEVSAFQGTILTDWISVQWCQQ